MKKTLTVNLNNIVFHIDDDAYEMLQNYLSEIADHFKSEEEKSEIMNDIEARIAELFTEKLQKNKNVISIVDVEEIIEIMGKPSQYTDEEEDENEAPKADKKQQHNTRRFYRDPENAILGGVAGGLAAYLGWDVTIIRILLVLSVFIGFGSMIPIYIVLWFVAPPALTASQRLEMQGENVTIDSIKTEMNNAKSYVESDKFKHSAKTFGDRVFDVLRIIMKVFFGFIGGILGLTGVIIVGVLLFLLCFFIFEPNGFNSFAPHLISNISFMTPENTGLFIISLLLVVGCPIFMLIYWAIRVASGKKEKSYTATWVVFILWLAGIFMLSSLSAKAAFNFHKNGESFFTSWSNDNKSLSDEVRVCDDFHSVEIDGDIALVLKQDSVQEVKISTNNDLSNVITEVNNGVLRIHAKNSFNHGTIHVDISVDTITSIVARGACTIETESQFILPEMSIALLGASTANMDLKVAGLLNVDIKGASTVNLTGTSTNFEIEALGASGVEAEDMIAHHTKVHVTGASRANVYAIESLDAQALGASEINCHGKPKIITKLTHIGSSIDID